MAAAGLGVGRRTITEANTHASATKLRRGWTPFAHGCKTASPCANGDDGPNKPSAHGVQDTPAHMGARLCVNG